MFERGRQMVSILGGAGLKYISISNVSGNCKVALSTAINSSKGGYGINCKPCFSTLVHKACKR
jgi:hypothetical protein